MRRLAVFCVAAFIVGLVLLNSPRGKEDVSNATDFSSFYCAAQIVRSGLGSQLYDLRLQAEFQAKVAAVHAFYNHPPYEALLFVPFTFLTYQGAYFAWTACNVVLLACAVLILDRTTKVRDALSQFARIRADRGLLFVVFLTFAPVTTCFLIGENSMLTLLAFTGTFALFQSKRNFFAGFLLAFALYKFQLVLPLVLVIAVRRKWASVAGFSVSAVFLSLVSIAVSGSRVIWEYPRFLAFESKHPELAGFHPSFMPNLRGLLSLLFFGRGGMMVTIVVAFVSAIVLIWAVKKWRDEELALSFCASVLATLLVSFHLYNYDLSLLLIPVSILCGSLAERGLLLRAKFIWMALAVLFIHPLHLFLLLHNVYAAMCVPVIVLFVGATRLLSSERTRNNALPMVTA